ncbi:hypothetical protein F8S12_03330 [Nostoc sp. WHI]|nr:hypothetical protein [Nostoc sp. WHI]
MLGLNEWREFDAEMRKKLTPHDQISNKKNFYTITPLGCKFINSEHHKLIMQLYDQLKQWERPDLVERVRQLENVGSLEEFKALKRQMNAKSN